MPVEKFTRCHVCGGRGKDMSGKKCVTCMGTGEVAVLPKKKPSRSRPKSLRV